MLITLYSILMAIITNSLLVILIYFFRKSKYFIHFFGVTVMLALYVLCFIRLAIPIEFPSIQYIIKDVYILPTLLNGLTNHYSGDKHNVIVAILSTVWIAGFAVLSYLRFSKYFKAVKKLSGYDNICPEVFQQVNDKIAKNVGIKKTIKVVMSDKISSPLTYGFFKPVIMLPSKDYTDKELKYILRHECCHTKNNDIWVKFLIELYCCTFWWNPFSYLLKKDLNFCLELRCDKRALKSLNEKKRTNYGKVLLDALKQRSYEKYPFLIGTEFSKKEDDNRLKQRFKLILRTDAEIKRDDKTSRIFGSLASVLVVLIICMSYIFIWQPHFEMQIEDTYDGNGLPSEYTLVDDTNSYIYKDEDGQYYLVVKSINKTVPISAEDVEAGMYEDYPLI